MVKGHVVARSVGLVGAELAVPAAARAVPDRVAEGMMGQHEDGLVRVFRLRGGQAFANPVLPVAVPAVVVAARMGRERQHVVAAASAHDEIAVGLALVRASRNLERSRYGQLGGEELLERSLGVLLVSLPAVVFVVAHYDPDGLARVRVEERGQLIVLRGRAGVRLNRPRRSGLSHRARRRRFRKTQRGSSARRSCGPRRLRACRCAR